MGKKYTIELEDEPFTSGDKKLYKCKGFNSLVFDENGIEILEKLTSQSTIGRHQTVQKYDLVIHEKSEKVGVVLECILSVNDNMVMYKVLFEDGVERNINRNELNKFIISKNEVELQFDIMNLYQLLIAAHRMMKFDRTDPIISRKSSNEIIENKPIHKRYQFTSVDFKVGQIFENIMISTCYDDVESVDLIVARVTDDTISFLPRYPFKTRHQMNDINTTDGGYENSKMKKVILAKYENAFKEVFSSYKVLRLDLLNEDDVFGKDRLPLFNVNEDFINNEINEAYDKNLIGSWGWWLRAVSISGTFAYVGTNGTAGNNSARYSYGVRPLLTLDLNSIREVLKKDNK